MSRAEPVDALAVMSRKRPTFRDAAMRRSYEACVAAYREKGSAYMVEGNSAAGMFRRGFTGQHAGTWDAASRKTVAYAAFRAGQDCAQDEARAAIAELIDKAETAEKVIRNLVTAGAHPNWANYADDLRAALARVGSAGGAA